MTALVFGLSMAAITHAEDAPAASRPIPINARPFGMTYGGWAAEWWKWAYSLPMATFPSDGPNEVLADCSAGQSGHVWFLAGAFTTTPLGDDVLGEANRTCIEPVPPGTALFVPLVNAECSTFAGDGNTEEALRACANDLIDQVTELFIEIDGVPLNDLFDFRAESPLFVWGPVPEGGILKVPAGTTSESVAAGYHVMIPPLPRGDHTIHFGGVADFGDFKFLVDVTYNLTVGL